MSKRQKSKGQTPKKYDPFDVVFCAECNKLHHADAPTYLQIRGDIYKGRKDGVVGQNLSNREKVTRVTVFCWGSKGEPSCLEKYLADCRSLDCQ